MFIHQRSETRQNRHPALETLRFCRGEGTALKD